MFLGIGSKESDDCFEACGWGTKGMSGMGRIIVREGETGGKVCVLMMKYLL